MSVTTPLQALSYGTAENPAVWPAKVCSREGQTEAGCLFPGESLISFLVESFKNPEWMPKVITGSGSELRLRGDASYALSQCNQENRAFSSGVG